MLNQLSAQDAQFLYMQSEGNLTHVTGASIYDPSTAPGGHVRFKDILAHFEGRLVTSPVFKRKLFRLPMDYDHPYLVEDKEFDLEGHIWHSRLPEPGDWRQFSIFMARHHSRPMDMSRPLWDIMVLEGLGGIEGFAKGSFAIITRVHHAAIDGASAAHFFAAISDIDAMGTPVFKVPEHGPDLGDTPSLAKAWMRANISNAKSPAKMARSVMRFAPAIISDARKNRGKSKSKDKPGIPDTRFNGAVSPQKVFDAAVFKLADLKTIKNKVEGATINDVVLTITAGALRKYLTKHGELPDESLVGWVPINARTAPGQDEAPGNNISAMTVKIGTDIVDPYKRLKAVRDVTRETKAAKSGVSARLLMDLSKHIPGATMANVARIMTSERFAPKLSNVFISNVPGPQIPLYMAGAKSTHQFALAPLGNGMGLFIATPSYNGIMSFNITSDRKIMPDVAFFRACLEDSFEELFNPKPKKPRKKARKKPANIKK